MSETDKLLKELVYELKAINKTLQQIIPIKDKNANNTNKKENTNDTQK